MDKNPVWHCWPKGPNAQCVMFQLWLADSSPIRPNNYIGTRRTEDGNLIARFQVDLEQDGRLHSYKKLDANDTADSGYTVWYAYDEKTNPNPSLLGNTYIDTLNKNAVDEFLRLTHEVLKETLGEEFGKTIPAIFMDEPQFPPKGIFESSDSDDDVIYPWTTDIVDSFLKTYSYKIEDKLPELIWNNKEDLPSVPRYHYHDHVCERFAEAFMDNVSSWCTKNGIFCTGHMMHEESLQCQSECLGEVMRQYRAQTIPGIDMLQNKREWNTAKQAQSACRQFGRPGMLCEEYGVTNWDFTFTGHKAAGDWLAAFGVSIRVHHLSWVSMGGGSKRDFPASIGYQSPWYKEYKLVEDYFSRINVAMTRGKSIVKIGVIHPIESYWLAYGSWQNTAIEREQRDKDFDDLCEWLIFGLIDFDYISESLLPQQSRVEDITDKFPVGECLYDVVIVPNLRTIRESTLQRLEVFSQKGGKTVFAGGVPSLVGATASERARKLADNCTNVALSRFDILGEMEPYRIIYIRYGTGFDLDIHMTSRRHERIVYQMREEGDDRFLFMCNTDVQRGYPNVVVVVKGDWHVTLLDTMNGSTKQAESNRQDGNTTIPWSFPAHGSVLLRLNKKPFEKSALLPQQRNLVKTTKRTEISQPYAYDLEEDNALVLDIAESRLNHESWVQEDELLRVRKRCQGILGYKENYVQPYMLREEPDEGNEIQLQFIIESLVDVENVDIALEDVATTTFFFDDEEVELKVKGWWVDKALQRVYLGDIKEGKHRILIKKKFGKTTHLEWLYLLGQFGVRVYGRKAVITALPKNLSFGDITRQDLAFYAGNLTYYCTIDTTSESTLHFPKMRCPLVRIAVDDYDAGAIAFAPYEVALQIPAGKHKLAIKCFGNRFNSFGQLHLIDQFCNWWGPNSYQTTDDGWSFEYQLREAGILVTPVLLEN